MIVVPYKGHDREWDERSRKRLDFLSRYSKEVVVVKEGYFKRDCYMVDCSMYMLAVCEQKKVVSATVKATIEYAERKIQQRIYVHPDTAEINIYTGVVSAGVNEAVRSVKAD